MKCSYFGRCGGCTSQHIPYELQLENKKKVVARAAGIDEQDVKVFSGEPYGYRNRMDFIFRPGGLGFRKKGKWYELIGIEECPISNPRLNGLLLEVQDHFKDADAFDVRKHTGTFRYAVIRTPGEDSSISFVLNAGSTRLAEAIDRVNDFAARTTANNVIVTRVASNSDVSIGNDYFVIKGTDMLVEKYLGYNFKYHVQGFFQNNSKMAEKMQEYAQGLLKQYPTQEAGLLDLYGGVGTFGIINAGQFREVMIIEGDEQCIKAAEENIKANQVNNAKAICLDAAKLSKLELQKPLFCITDPPRSGMHPKAIAALKELKPECIIYISCNPSQLEKELPKLGYKVKSAALFDLFPQTPHMEAVVELNPS